MAGPAAQKRSRLRPEPIATSECCAAVEGFLKDCKSQDLGKCLQPFEAQKWHLAASPEVLAAFAPLATRVFQVAPRGVLGHAVLRQAILASHKAQPILHFARGADLEADRLSGILRLMLGKMRDVALDVSRARAIRKAGTPEQLRLIQNSLSLLHLPPGKADHRSVLSLPAVEEVASHGSQGPVPASESPTMPREPSSEFRVSTCTDVVPFMRPTSALVCFGLVVSNLPQDFGRGPGGQGAGGWSPFVWPHADPEPAGGVIAPAGSVAAAAGSGPPATPAGLGLALAANILGAGTGQILSETGSQTPLPAAIRGQSKRVAAAVESGGTAALGKPKGP